MCLLLWLLIPLDAYPSTFWVKSLEGVLVPRRIKANPQMREFYDKKCYVNYLDMLESPGVKTFDQTQSEELTENRR